MKWQALIDSLLHFGQYAPAATRHAVFERRWDGLSAAVRALLEKTAGAAYKVTDEDLAVVETSEDETFELIVCTAAGAADRTLRAGLLALQQASAEAQSERPASWPDPADPDESR